VVDLDLDSGVLDRVCQGASFIVDEPVEH
jgi:hypothetical protein